MKMSFKFFGFLAIMLLLFSVENQAQHPEAKGGKIIRIENFPAQYVSPRNIDIWIPESYNREKKYAVLYMHDGQMLFDSTNTWNKQEWGVDETVSKLVSENKIRDCIVVGIWNAGQNRHSEYFPGKALHMLSQKELDSLVAGGSSASGKGFKIERNHSDAYLKFLTRELKPFVDSTFSTLAGKENTFIAGSSMGGLISMYAICEYPEVFGGAACMSTHWIGISKQNYNPVPDAFLRYLEKNLPDPEDHKIYYDYGTETLDAAYEPHQLRVDVIMRKAGYDKDSWITRKFPGADHSENAWKARLHIPLVFLMGIKN